MARLVRKEAALDFARAAEKFLEYYRAKGLSEHTVKWYGGKLASFGAYVGTWRRVVLAGPFVGANMPCSSKSYVSLPRL